MNLFHSLERAAQEVLPYDGEVYYHGPIFDIDQSMLLFKRLLSELDWKADEVLMNGERIQTKRKVAWYGDQAYSYQYSSATKIAQPWPALLASIKTKIEEKTQTSFNSCLANLYHSGQEGMSWHSDDEHALVKNGSIASISFGAERWFHFKHKRTADLVKIFLENGSLLIMKGETQRNWTHRLPPTTKINHARVNLTFRQIEPTRAGL